MDKTVRVWELSKGDCIRVIYGVSSQLCIRFHPVSSLTDYLLFLNHSNYLRACIQWLYFVKNSSFL